VPAFLKIKWLALNGAKTWGCGMWARFWPCCNRPNAPLRDSCTHLRWMAILSSNRASLQNDGGTRLTRLAFADPPATPRGGRLLLFVHKPRNGKRETAGCLLVD